MEVLQVELFFYRYLWFLYLSVVEKRSERRLENLAVLFWYYGSNRETLDENVWTTNCIGMD